jgi:SAM-dependent methyltransferase
VAEPVSDALQTFIDGAPLARGPHLAFLRRAAEGVAPGSTVLDVGAGDAPFRELFPHVSYVTCDWENSTYRPDPPPDLRAPADSIPLGDDTVDAILCTQVLEHVPQPLAVLTEFHRLLRPGGRLWMTAPLVWYLHEQPHDYYRYTPHGLRYLLERAGFSDIDIVPLSDAFSTLAQLVAELGWMIGRQPDGRDEQRSLIAQTMTQLASLIGSFSDFDAQWLLPLDYSVVATAP